MMGDDLFDIFAAARQVPHAPALVHARGLTSYAELAELAARALGWLKAHSGAPIGPNTSAPVALLAVPCVEQVAMAYAAFAAGVPLLPVHPRSSDRDRERLLEAVGARVLVFPGWHEQPHAIARRSAGPKPAAEASLALVQTSGSSSTPRLARLSRRAFAASAHASSLNLGWQPNDRWLLALPFAHIGGLSVLTRCLAARQAIALVDPEATRGERALAEALHRHRVSLLSLVPTQVERLLALRDLSVPPTLRATLIGGATCSEATLTRARARGLVPLATYGLTEACSQVCTRSLVPKGPETGAGCPLSGVEVRIHQGGIEVRGPTLFSGYWSEENTWRPSEWFATGDLGYLDDAGCLHVTGRRSELIITGGENVHPAEVEAVLAPHLAPRRLCVFGRTDPTWGEVVAIAIEGSSDPRLVARVVQISSEQLASFKRPRLLAFVATMPELASGKLARHMLSEISAPSLVPLDYSAKT